MFTGIITHLGTIAQVEKTPKESRITIETGMQNVALGESIAVNGVCLTVAEWNEKSQSALFFVSEETLNRSNLAALAPGHLVHLERALCLSDRLSGHLVQGHVDAVGWVMKVEERNESHFMRVSLPRKLGRYCIEKGSICIDGVSLTINALKDRNDSQTTEIELNLIPHTFKMTRFGEMSEGFEVNIEVDLVAKYIERLSETEIDH